MSLEKVKKIAIVIFVIGISIVLLIITNINKNKNSKELEIINNIVDVALNSTDTVMLYIGGDSCAECMLQAYQMKLFLSEHGLNYYYINLDELSKSESKKVLSKLSLDSNIKKPTIAIYENGKLTVTQSGVTGTNSLYNLLKDYNLIMDKGLKINYLTLTKYVEKIEEGPLILGIGSMKSNESIIFEETLWQLHDEYNIEIDFIYASNLNKAEGKLFESKIKNIDEYEILIPSLLIISDGNILSAKIGSAGIEEYVEFLKENGIIK